MITVRRNSNSTHVSILLASIAFMNYASSSKNISELDPSIENIAEKSLENSRKPAGRSSVQIVSN